MIGRALAIVGIACLPWWAAVPARGGDDRTSDSASAAPVAPRLAVVSCSSRPGERQHCPADTSKGVALARTTGERPCLLGKTWGYDDEGVWVSDGCGGEFVLGQAAPEA